MRRLTVFLLCSVLSCFSQTAAVQIPATPAGKLFSLWLESFNSNDPAQIGKFQAEHFDPRETKDPAARVQRTMSLRKQTGGFELQKIEVSTDNRIVGVIKEKNSSNLARFTIEAEPSDPNRIADINLELIPPPSAAPAAPPAKVPVPQLVQDVDGKLTQLTADDKFSGAALIAKDGKVLWEKAYGMADREAKIPNTVNTAFHLGSMNKMFTAVAVAQLVEKGKLKFTDTIAQVLPDYPNKEVAAKVTVAQLLTHSAGFGSYFTPEFEEKKDSIRQLKDYLPIFVNQPLKFEPGKGWSYSNSGFVVLGLIIEKVSGENYYDYMQKHVYDVAGMKNTGSPSKDQKLPNLAIGYTRHAGDDDNGPLQSNISTLPWRGSPAGGGVSTVEDLLRFDQALRQHKLLSAEMTATVLTGKVQPAEAPQRHMYAYGFSDAYVNGEHMVGHNGGAPGMNAQLDMHMDNGYTVVVLANRDPRAAEEWSNYISSRLQ